MNDKDLDNKIEIVDFVDEIRDNFLDYAMSVIVSRAIPSVNDGLKPVHRRIIHAMNELNINHNSSYKKSARIVGEVIGKYHPHGDSAVYQTMVRMAQPFTYRYPLIDGHGNFGSMDGDAPAAMRYTEVRLSKISSELTKNINKKVVKFQYNYDESEIEPQLLPAIFPNLLANGSQGIAVGMATNIPPHNLVELIDASIYLINNPDCDINQLLSIIKGPDFPTGGYINRTQETREAYLTGRGMIKIKAKYHIETKNKSKSIVFTELPYQVNKARLLERIAELAKSNIIKSIKDLNDESNHKGVRVVIKVKNNIHNIDFLINKLFKLTPLQTTFHFNLISLKNNEPKLMNLKEILQSYIDHNINIIVKENQFDFIKYKKEINILLGLKIATKNIDKIIKIIKKSESTKTASDDLAKAFDLNPEQVKAILEMKLQKLTKLEKTKIYNNILKIKNNIKLTEEIINSFDKQKKVLIEKITKIKEDYGDKRRSIIANDLFNDYDDEDLIKNEDCYIIFTKNNYIKRSSDSSFKIQKRGGKGVFGISSINNDEIKFLIKTKTLDYLLLFTNKGNVYNIKPYLINEYSRNSHGIPIVNLIKNIDDDEEILSIINVNLKNDNDKSLLFLTKKGIINKIKLSKFSNNNERFKISRKKAITLSTNDTIVDVILLKEKSELLIVSSNGKSIKINENLIRNQGRGTRGVKGIKLIKNNEAIGVSCGFNDQYLLIVSEYGYGKKILINQFRNTNRNTQGVFIFKVSDKTGNLKLTKIIDDDSDVIFTSLKGKVILINNKSIPLLKGKTSIGVKLFNIDKNSKDSLLTATIIPKHETETEQETKTEIEKKI